jgi:hypothetical protein
VPLKQIFAPHLNRTVKMGRRRPVARGPRLFFRNYLRLPAAPPPTADYSRAASPVLGDIYLNDQLGDCVIAGGYHVVGVETGNAGDLFGASDDQIIADYGAIGGYVPGDPSTDNGCDEATALNYWTEQGFADGTKLVGWLAVDPTNKQEMQSALYLFENLFFGMELPDAWINPAPAGSGFRWDVAGPSDPNNGHCVIGVGYGAGGVTIDTWGLLGTLTYGAIAQYCAAANNGELYVMLTPDQLAKGQSKAPNGVDWSELISDFKSMGGNVPTLAARRSKPKLAAKPKRARAIPAAWGGSGMPAGTIVAAAPMGTITAHAAPMGTMVARAAPMGTMVAHAAPMGTMAARTAPWMPPPYPASYPVPPAPPAPPPPLSEFGERVMKKVMRSPALGVVAVVGLVVLGVVGVVGLSGGSEE